MVDIHSLTQPIARMLMATRCSIPANMLKELMEVTFRKKILIVSLKATAQKNMNHEQYRG